MTISAPYNFVPLSSHVALAGDISTDLAGPPSQDHPQPGGGLSGTIALSLTAQSPFLEGKADENGVKRFFTDPDHNPALPGSSLRGAIRNVLEIANFGRMALVDDQRVGMRDLSPGARIDYGNKVSETLGKDHYRSRAFAGWLQLVKGVVMLTPCDHARVDHRDTLNALSMVGEDDFRTRIAASATTTMAEEVERIYLGGADVSGFPATLNRTLCVQDSPTDHTHKKKTLQYRKAANTCANAQDDLLAVSATPKTGTLVFTGMPNRHKHMEFFFFDDVAPQAPQELPEEVFNRFLSVHEEQEKESRTWARRKVEFYSGRMIPVFYLKEGFRIAQIGLSMMFKLSVDQTVGELIRNTCPEHRNVDGDLDLPTRIFGRIAPDGATTGAFRTRVSFGWGRVEDGSWTEAQETRVHLLIPKVSYYPSYVRQRPADSNGNAATAAYNKSEWGCSQICRSRSGNSFQAGASDRPGGQEGSIQTAHSLPQPACGRTWRNRLGFDLGW